MWTRKTTKDREDFKAAFNNDYYRSLALGPSYKGIQTYRKSNAKKDAEMPYFNDIVKVNLINLSLLCFSFISYGLSFSLSFYFFFLPFQVDEAVTANFKKALKTIERKSSPTEPQYTLLLRWTLRSILFFNKRRSNEPAGMTVQEFHDRVDGQEAVRTNSVSN